MRQSGNMQVNLSEVEQMLQSILSMQEEHNVLRQDNIGGRNNSY